MSILVRERTIPRPSNALQADAATPSSCNQCQCCLRTVEHESLRGWLLDVARQVDGNANGFATEWNKTSMELSRNIRSDSTVIGIIRRQTKEVAFRHTEDNNEYMEMYRRHKETRNSTDRSQAEADVRKFVNEMKNKLERSAPSPTTKPSEEGKYFQVLGPNESPLKVHRLLSSARKDDEKSNADTIKQKKSSPSEEDPTASVSSFNSESHEHVDEQRIQKPLITVRPGSQNVFSHFAECLKRSRRARSSSTSSLSGNGKTCLRLASGPKSVDLMSSIHLLSSNGNITASTLPARSHTVIGIADRQRVKVRPQTMTIGKTTVWPRKASSDYCDKQLAFPSISRELRKSFQIRGERASTAGTVRPSLRRELLIVNAEVKHRTQRQCPRSAVAIRRQGEEE